MRLAWIAVGLLAAHPAFADEPPPPAPDPAAPAPVLAPPSAAPPVQVHKDIVITVDRDRDAKNIGITSAIAGVGVLFGALGVYYNLDSQTNANAVSQTRPTNEPWTSAQQAQYDRAHDSGVKAGVFYGIGGAALIGAIVYFIATAPGEDQTVIHPHYGPTVAPTAGGAVLGGAWSF
jgi:hypothetical protein